MTREIVQTQQDRDNITEVTKAFIKDLKKADGVILRIDGNHAAIDLLQKERRLNGWTRPEQRVAYNGFPASVPTGKTSACAVMCYKDQSGFMALERIIRDGDSLCFRASVDNNGYLSNARIPASAWDDSQRNFHNDYENLYHEKIHCQITRKEKHLMSLFIDDRISVDNSARLIA